MVRGPHGSLLTSHELQCAWTSGRRVPYTFQVRKLLIPIPCESSLKVQQSVNKCLRCEGLDSTVVEQYPPLRT